MTANRINEEDMIICAEIYILGSKKTRIIGITPSRVRPIYIKYNFFSDFTGNKSTFISYNFFVSRTRSLVCRYS